ncbi:MAG: S1C family serine protease [Bythopirellula sp.]
MIARFPIRLLLAACCLPGLVCYAAPDPTVLEAQQQRIEVMQQAAATTVAVFDGGGQGGGSGVVISPDGFALTNFHVTAPCGAAMKCGMADGKVYDAVIVGVDPVGDVALIQLLGRDDFPYAALGDSDQVAVGDWVFTSGNPFLLADDFTPSIAYGMVSGVQRYQYPAGTLLEYTDCIQTDAAINPGNSGGPLFTANGDLIGINGRGSFEKRGRVNVGVGYAISINQIKHFLPQLKSGRIVDHATLGAIASTTSAGKVKIDEILETSDAFRRGLRYGDEIVQFANRDITTANRLKNALGIFPRGWLVPLTYRRDGQHHDIAVRLMGVHDQAQLYNLVQQQEQKPPAPPNRKTPQPDEGDSPDPKRKLAELLKRKSKMPEVVAKQFESRRGYANYWYNERIVRQLWENYPGREALEAAGYDWKIVGGDIVGIEINKRQAKILMPTLEAGANFSAELSTQLSPPNSGGLLLTLHLWQRLIEKGLKTYGEVYYLGQLPRRHDGELVDCLIGIYAGIETCFQFDRQSGNLSGIVMLPSEGVDPCDLQFSDYGELDGRLLPRQWRVCPGDLEFLELEISSWSFAGEQQGEQN